MPSQTPNFHEKITSGKQRKIIQSTEISKCSIWTSRNAEKWKSIPQNSRNYWLEIVGEIRFFENEKRGIRKK